LKRTKRQTSSEKKLNYKIEILLFHFHFIFFI